MSELHKRLAHLVNYSSQLIFVSGDSIADQQRTLNDFLSRQQDNTEVSFFSASNAKQASDYRAAICRQLGGHEVGSFVRPLQQLLSDKDYGLSSEGGPYLVCVTQAELLSPAFLQELWDWVMYSQQTSPGIHLNIILFGESTWAKKSQIWLPSQNSHKPVLLSSQSVNPIGFDVHALEALMADKSSWFSTSNQPMVANKWFISSILLIFLVVFVGLMSWQYPEHVASLMSGKQYSENDSPLSKNVEERDNDEVLNTQATWESGETRTPIFDDPLATLQAPLSATESQLELVETNVLLSTTKPPLGSPTILLSQKLTDELLVGSWSDLSERNKAAKFINDPINKAINEPINESIASSNIGLAKTSVVKPQIESKPNTIPSNTQVLNPAIEKSTSENNTDGDFKVPDIISVEQLDAQFSRQPDPNLVFAPLTPTQSPTITKQIPQLPQSAIDYQFDETTLLSLPIDSVVLQLSGIQNPVVLESFLTSNNLKSSTWVYKTQRYGGPWYVVLYRQSFESIDAALSQLSNLPADIREAQPFAKSINQIQQEINRR